MRRNVAALTVALVVALVLLSAGCSAGGPTAEMQKAECEQNMALIHTEMGLFHADTGEYPPLTTVVEKTGAKCPAGGVYAFDPNTETVSCSIHGVYKP